MHQPTAFQVREAERYQDGLIHAALPAWLRAATVPQLQALQDASALSLYWRERCERLLAPLQGVDAFCAPLLEQALQAQWPGLTPQALSWRSGQREPVITSQPIGYPVTTAVYHNVSVLEAAMANFSAEQTEPGGMLAGNRLEWAVERADALPTPAAFAAFCRSLDLGAQYQRHVRQLLRPDGQAGVEVLSVLARHQRYAMLVDVHRARIEGLLNDEEHTLLVRLCGLHWPLTLGEDRVQVRRLTLLGCALEQIMVVDVRDEDWSPLATSSRQIIVYIPGDPQSPLRRYASLRRFANDLGKRLRTPAYQRFFSRFVRRRDSQRFFSAVINGYAAVGDLANIDLEEHLSDWATPPFDALAGARIAQIEDDASLIATPVAQLDQALQREHDQRLAAEGWTLLNLAGLFVPGLGVVLLGVTAWQLLDEVYLGVQAWRDGDQSEALDHLFNVALEVASVAAVAVGAGVVHQAWTRSPVVDELLPLAQADAKLRLGRADVQRWRTEVPAQALRDAQGVRWLGERSWVDIDGHSYAVHPAGDADRWTLRTDEGVVHELTHNGAGAWRFWFEQPAQWRDARYLFRRLALSETPLSDEAIDVILQATDTDADQLRGLHVQGRKADALLRDTTLRVSIDVRLGEAIARLRSGQPLTDRALLEHARRLPGAAELDDQALAELMALHRRALHEQIAQASQYQDGTAVAPLLRDFPRLSRAVAQDLLEHSHALDRQRLLETGRVPANLARAARRAQQRERQARAYQGLFMETLQTPDLARLAVSLTAHLPAAHEPMAWRLFEADQRDVAIWVVGEAPTARRLDLVHDAGTFELLDAEGRVLSPPGELFSTLAVAYGEPAREVLGVGEPFAHNLRVLLGRQALVERKQLAQLLGQRPPQGWFQVPERLADGRLGYPLSGRGRGLPAPRGLGARVRMLYPLMSDEQIEQWAEQLRASGQQIERELGRLASEMHLLQRTLQRWVLGGSGMLVRIDRSRFSDQLVSAWRRMTPRLNGGTGHTLRYRLQIRGTQLPSLPSLPEVIRLSHIDELSLRNAGLREVPAEFMRSFPALRILDLSGNRLQRLPPGIDQIRGLSDLSLENNAIELDAAQATVLSRCESLRILNLAGNPLRMDFSVRRMNRLHALSLRSTQLPSFPVGLLERPELMVADLRDNRISELPEAFFQAPQWLANSILVDANPFDEATLGRLRLMASGVAAAVSNTNTTPSALLESWLSGVEPMLEAQRRECWEALRSRSGAEGLFDLLSRLRQTAEFNQANATLVPRVWSLLEAAVEHPDLGEELFNLANLPLTCQDSAALSFSSLELHMLVWQARLSARSGAVSEQQALLHLGRQLWRLDEVQRIALADIAARRADGADPDEIEVALAYRVGLREPLDLPAQPQDMLFAEVSGVDPARLERARLEVLSAEQPSALAASLAQREFWRTWLEHHYSERLQALDAPFHERLLALMDQAEASATQDGDYLQQINAVRDEREAARAELYLTLTQAILDAQTPR
ncbi:NEL-type E3 ubiquitin ligase domain-containing protein [Pseudomonas sp.]|uniref:NEL-type E3 ubiquitin ligase domain-containing protein n=1 Tax=Pseudomonas sp. TaxID=306 RepID=UPI0028B07C2E|nr:NEL-type E3 ubiquitin ligase domain-containing protein [Pseudomonas sp.]